MHEIQLACGAIAWASGKMTELEHLGTMALVVGGGIACILVLLFHRTLVAVLAVGAVLMVGYWLVAGGGIQWGSKQISGETGSGAASSITAQANPGGAC